MECAEKLCNHYTGSPSDACEKCIATVAAYGRECAAKALDEACDYLVNKTISTGMLAGIDFATKKLRARAAKSRSGQ